jgi:hypothetical protein
VKLQWIISCYESAAAHRLWEMSESMEFHYITLLGDGNAMAFSYLKETKIHVANAILNKEECTNHMQNRFGTTLINQFYFFTCTFSTI